MSTQTPARSSSTEASPVAAALAACRTPFILVGLFSGIINLLMLSGSFYMLQVYDRVLTSRSVPTLIGLSLLLLAAYALQGLLDAFRTRMLSRIGALFDERLAPLAFTATQALPLAGARPEQATQPLRDLDQIRSFLGSLGPTALFDMPWMPLFFAGCFLLHPWLGYLAISGGLVIVGLTLLTEARSRKSVKAQTISGLRRQAIAEAGRRNAEAISAMGMAHSFRERWTPANRDHVRDSLATTDAAGGIGAFAKVFRMILQSAVLGLGAFLVIRGEMSGGAMIAASIMTSRALAPVEIAVAHWKGFTAAKQGYARLEQLLAAPLLAQRERTLLPAPRLHIAATDLFVGAPGRAQPILQGPSLRLTAGHGLGIIGPSASGKSTLARALVGVWRPLKGEVRLDGAALDQWDPKELGRHVGYLPQDIELFDGTVAENIARFDAAADAAAIVAAAQSAGAHDLILQLEQGYDTRIGEGGAALSGGQRQRIALARALYGAPFLVVLDEPNSNLDHEGDEALTAAIRAVRARGGIVVVVTHRPAALAGIDQVAVMAEGRIKSLGPKDQVLQQVMRQGGLPAVQKQEIAS
jgi:ATP-binding cassette subfamily C protein